MPSCRCSRADMAFTYFQYRSEVFSSLMSFVTTCLLPARCLETTFSRDFSQHPSTRPATLHNITQGYKGDQKPWFYTQYFMKSHILGSIRPLFLETTCEYSETHLELQPVLLLLCTHSQLSLVDVQVCLLLWS